MSTRRKPSRPKHHPFPHDHFFRFVFSKPLHARSLLRRLLPSEVARRLAWPTVRVEPGTYVDSRLAATASDVLLSIRLRGSSKRALVYLLFDHQSTRDDLMPLRMLGYAFQAWSDYLARADAIPGYLPPLVPILLYQGRRPWRSARHLSELHDLPGAPPSGVPAFIELRMILHELHADPLPPQELTVLVRAALGLMKLVSSGEMELEHAALVARWFIEVRRAHGRDAALAFINYFFHTGPDTRMIDAVVEELPKAMRAPVMTIAQQLEARGHQQGRLEGQLEGQREGQATLILRLLSQRFGKLPLRVIRRVRGGTLGDLDRWSERLLGAATLEEVFSADD